MMNNVNLVGRLTKDPELKYTQTGIAVARFTLAVQRDFDNAEGKKEADFIPIVVWRKQAENVSNYLRKGSLVALNGRIQTGSYDGQDGKRVFTTEVVSDKVSFLDPKPSGDAQGNQQSQEGNQQQSQQGNQQQQQQQQQQYNQQQSQQNYTRTDNDPFSTGGGPIEVSDDDLPF